MNRIACDVLMDFNNNDDDDDDDDQCRLKL
jgi:hypothetical protein